MTQTLTTETIKLWRINAEITVGETNELDPENNAAKAILDLTAELLRYREAAENPSCWEIAGQLFTTKEDALKPGYVGTPEPLYDGPVLTDDREAQPVAEVLSSRSGNDTSTIDKALPAGTKVYTATPAATVPDGSARQEAEHVASILELIGSFEADDIDGDTVDLRFELDGVDTGSDASITEYASRGSAVINQLLRIPATQPVSSGYKLPDNVREALTLALQAMEFMGDTLNNIDAVCTEDVEYVTPAFTAVRGLLEAAPEGGNG